jgi:thiamine-phosphate pyrophosphorylase
MVCMRISGIYVITDETLYPGRTHEEIAEAAVAGGARIVQLRDKSASDRRLYEAAAAIRAITSRARVLFTVNNRVDIALAVGADGVNVGQQDMPVWVARRLLGPGKLVGASVGTIEEARRAAEEGADHLGAGPVFDTTTKVDAGEATGVALIRRLAEARILPVVAIGGINESNIGEVAAAGADAAAVISAVVKADDMEKAVAALAARFEAAGRKIGHHRV